MRFISKRVIAAVVIAASTCIAVSAQSASAAGPILHAESNDAAHVCTVLGYDNLGNKGVVCVDLQTHMEANSWELFPVADAKMEIVCVDKSGNEVQCAEAHEWGLIANAQTGAGTRYEFDCGHQWGPCSGGHNGTRDVTDMGSEYYPNEGETTCPFAYINNVWAVVFGQGSFTEIELPGSGKWVHLDSTNANDSGNESTGHYYICP